jgi:hypothetical protein
MNYEPSLWLHRKRTPTASRNTEQRRKQMPVTTADEFRRLEGKKTYAQLEKEIERLRDLLAWNGINPDGIIQSAKGAAREYSPFHNQGNRNVRD